MAKATKKKIYKIIRKPLKLNKINETVKKNK